MECSAKLTLPYLLQLAILRWSLGMVSNTIRCSWGPFIRGGFTTSEPELRARMISKVIRLRICTFDERFHSSHIPPIKVTDIGCELQQYHAGKIKGFEFRISRTPCHMCGLTSRVTVFDHRANPDRFRRY